MTTVIHVNDNEFQTTVLNAELPVVVDFWAPWCTPCKAIAPILDKLAAQYEGKVLFTKVNTDENPEWAMKNGIQGIPTMLFINKGAVKDRLVGAQPAQVIQTKIEELVSSVKA
jgi:thioredoxin 1